VEIPFAEEHTGRVKTTQDAIIIWHFSGTAEAASRNEAVSKIPQIQFRFWIAWRLSALQQEIIDKWIAFGIPPGLVW